MEMLDKGRYFKITYGKSAKKWDNRITNWIGINIYQEKYKGETESEYKIKYAIKDEEMVVFDVVEGFDGFKKTFDTSMLFFAFPLLKLVDKAKKMGIERVRVSNVSSKKLLDAMKMFTIGNQRIFLSQEKINTAIKIIDVFQSSQVIWQLRILSDVVVFRTKAAEYSFSYLDKEGVFELFEKSQQFFYEKERIAKISSDRELENNLKMIELKEAFKEVKASNLIRVFKEYKGGVEGEVEKEKFEYELKKFFGDVEKFSSLEEVEQQLIETKEKEIYIYGKRVFHYKLKECSIVRVLTKNLGAKLIVAKEEKLGENIRTLLEEDLSKEVINF